MGDVTGHGLEEILGGVGFGYGGDVSVFLVVGHDVAGGITAGHDGADGGVDDAQALKGFLAAHAAGDGEVKDHKLIGVGLVDGILIRDDGVCAIADAIHAIVVMFEEMAGELRHSGFVVHNENALTLAFGVGVGAGRFFGKFGPGVGGDGEVDEEGGPSSGRGANGDVAAVFTEDGVGGGKPESAAPIFGGVVGFKDAGGHVGSDAAALVADFEAEVVAGGEVEGGAGVEAGAGEDKLDDPAFGHGFVGVDDQVLEGLADLAGVDMDEGFGGEAGKFVAAPGSAQGEGGDIL